MISERIFKMAQVIANKTPNFLVRRGPGMEAGNGVTYQFLRTLDEAVTHVWSNQVNRQERIAEGLRYSFDYYVPSEQTAIEIALSLYTPLTEFEKDIFKAILAKKNGKRIKKLVLIGKRGSVARQSEPGPTAIKSWVKEKHGIFVEVKELT